MREEPRITEHEELRGAGLRRVVEAMRLISEEMSDFGDEDMLPEVPAGVLMTRRSEGGGMQMR